MYMNPMQCSIAISGTAKISIKTHTSSDDNSVIQLMESGNHWKEAEFVSLQTV